jgi:hypothetical protein
MLWPVGPNDPARGVLRQNRAVRVVSENSSYAQPSRRAVVVPYHGAWNDQGLGNELITPGHPYR